MKKLIYIIIVFLFMPLVTFAKEIEVKSINEKENYNDIELVENSSGIMINFTISDSDYTKEATFIIKIQNNTTDIYNLNFKDINKLNNMNITSNKTVLNPGENEIEVTITRPDINISFFDEQESTITLELINDKNEDKEIVPLENKKENPKTGKALIVVVTVSIIFISLAVLIYIKTKKSSVFFALLPFLFTPIIINALEDNSIKIKINTIVTDGDEICIYGDAITPGIFYEEATYQFKYNDLILNTNEDDILEKIFNTDIKLTKNNILSFFDNMENTSNFDMNTLEEHLNDYFDYDNEELMPVNGMENLGYAYRDSLNNNLYTIVYNDTKDELTLLVSLGIKYYTNDEDGYGIKNIKIIFNKNNDDYLLYVNNNYYVDFGYMVVVNPIGYEYDISKERVIPVISIKRHINNIIDKTSIMNINNVSEENTYTLDNNTFTESTIKDYDFNNQLYRMKDNNITYIYYPESGFLNNNPFKENFLFRNTNNEEYVINSNSAYLNNPYEMSITKIDENPCFDNKYMLLLSEDYSCYSMGIK